MKIRPVMSGERKAFRLRHRRHGRFSLLMSSVVHVHDAMGVTICHITFSDHLVDTLGKHMPRGVGLDDPVFLRVEHKLDGTWHVHCQYIRGKESVLLWIAEEKPSWIRGATGFSDP